MSGVRRLVPIVAWLLATLFLAGLSYRTLGAEAAALAALLLAIVAARWQSGRSEDLG